MPCALPKQCELHFLKSGIRILPYDMTTETPYHWMSSAKVKVSREAGELIEGNHVEAEPVLIKINDTPQDRYYFSGESITLDDDVAHIDLWDAMNILKRGVLQEQFPSAKLRDIITFIITHRDDPSGVITGISHPGDGSGQERTADFEGEERAEVSRGSGTVDDVADAIRTTLLNLAEGGANFLGMDVEEGGIYLEQESPWVAIQKCMEEFSFTPWVDVDGKFHYASPSVGTGRSFGVNVGTDAFKLSEYNFFMPQEQPASTRIRGTYQLEGIEELGGIGGTTLEGVYLIGEAHYPGSAKCVIPQGEPRDLHSLEAVENAAARDLNDEWMRTNSGNFVINSAASNAKSLLAQLRSGDVVIVTGSLGNCDKKDRVVDGGYMVHNVNHELNTTVGWQTTITVSLIPPQPVTSSFVYDTRNNTRYSDLQEYNSELNPTTSYGDPF